MKRIVSLIMAMTLILGLCACSIKISIGSGSSGGESKSESSSAAEPETVTIEDTQTEYGLIQIPQINEKMLAGEDARLANEMFRSIRDKVQALCDDCKMEWNGESYHDAVEPLSVARYTQNGSLLSLTVKYIEMYPYTTSIDYYAAVNIDTSTGKALDHHEVIKSAGFTEEEVMAALRYYAECSMFYEWERSVYYTCAEEGRIPEGLGDPSFEWQETLDELAANYDTPPTPQGESWESPPYYPAVYMGEDGLEICLKVPTAAGAGYCNTMVHIGHNAEETGRLNPNTPYGNPFGQGAILSDDAYDIVAQSVAHDNAYSDGRQYSISADSMEIINTGDITEPVYVFRVYSDATDDSATAGWYAVGVFSRTLWQRHIDGGEWVKQQS